MSVQCHYPQFRSGPLTRSPLASGDKSYGIGSSRLSSPAIHACNGSRLGFVKLAAVVWGVLDSQLLRLVLPSVEVLDCELILGSVLGIVSRGVFGRLLLLELLSLLTGRWLVLATLDWPRLRFSGGANGSRE